MNRNDVSFLAIGQCGGNIGKLFESAGFNVVCINTSIEDLETIKAKQPYHITGAEGSAKDRNISKRLITNGEWSKINQFIDDKLKTPFVYVIFSAAGGTGSGASPMLIDNLIGTYPDKNIGAIVVLPSQNESLQAQANAVEAMREMQNIDGICSVFAIDNSKAEDKKLINETFVNDFISLLGLPDVKNIDGVIDNADLKRSLTAGGYGIIGRLTKEQSSTERMLSALSGGIYVPAEKDELIEYVVLSASASIDLQKIKEQYGEPLATFQSVNPDETVCLLSGLSAPQARLNGIANYVKSANEKRQMLRAKKKVDALESLNVAIDVPEQKREIKKRTAEDIWAKYLRK